MAADQRRAEVAGALVALMKDDDPFVRQAALRALAVWGSKDDIAGIAAAVDHPDVFTRKAALATLGSFKEAQAAEIVARRLPTDRFDVGRILQKMGPVAQPAVLKYIDHAEWTVRMEVCNILKAIGNRDSMTALEGATRDANGIVARAARQALDAVAARP